MTDLDFVKSIGRFGVVVGDGADEDDDPDILWCDSGTVTLAPLQTYTNVPGSATPWIGGQANIDCPIDTDGYMTFNGREYVQVVDLTSSKVFPSIPAGKATHNVKFSNVSAQGMTVTFPSFNVRLAADSVDDSGVIQLAKVAPAPAPGGTPIVQGPTGRGITEIAVVGDALVVTLTDDSTQSTTLPTALVDSVSFVANQVATNPDIQNTLSAAYVAPSGKTTAGAAAPLPSSTSRTMARSETAPPTTRPPSRPRWMQPTPSCGSRPVPTS